MDTPERPSERAMREAAEQRAAEQPTDPEERIITPSEADALGNLVAAIHNAMIGIGANSPVFGSSYEIAAAVGGRTWRELHRLGFTVAKADQP